MIVSKFANYLPVEEAIASKFVQNSTTHLVGTNSVTPLLVTPIVV
ncbi:MAG: hypothetical protein ACOYMQ_05270 [Pseudanabaena sp.]